MKKLSLRDLEIKNQKILMRVDFNVPLTDEGKVSDDTRIRESLPSIEYILSHGGKLILMSHLGRPKGKKDPKLSLKPIAKHLSHLLGKPVQMAPDTVGDEVKALSLNLKNGDVLLLENLRFYEGEEHPEKDPSFTEKLAELGDAYVNDAFGTAHRAHGSTALITKYFPKKSALGFLMEKEVSSLSELVLSPRHPFYIVIGGAKIGTKLGVLKSLMKKVDGIFIGGGMTFTFLKAKNIPIGDSILEEDQLTEAKNLLSQGKIFLPEDLVIASAFSNDAKRKLISIEEGIPSEWRGMDIGPKTLKAWKDRLNDAKMVFWNGPMGVCEFPHFAKGTHDLARLLGSLSCVTIAGGGDSIAAIRAANLQNNFSHISTGGGALLEFLEFGHLPGIDALTDYTSKYR